MMAKMTKGNNVFSQAAAERMHDQEEKEQAIMTGKPIEKTVGRGRPATNDAPTKTVSIRMTDERRQKLKIYAATNNRTISDIIGEFIDNL